MSEFERRARQWLTIGNVRQAGGVIAREYARQGRQGLGFSWSEGHPATRDAELLLLQGHEELDATPEQRKRVAVELALVSLTDKEPGAETVLAALGGSIKCPPLEAFLAEPPCSKRIAAYMGASPSDVAELYAFSMLGRAAESRNMERILESRAVLRDEMLGVRVLPAGEPCSRCGTATVSYRWGEVPEC